VSLKAFIFLLVVTIVAVMGAAHISEMLVEPGFERGIIIAVLAGLVVFPAARWAEYRGWIKGDWSPGGPMRKQRDAQKAREAAERQQIQDGTREGGESLQAPAADDKNQTSTAGEVPSRAAGPNSPGDPR